MVSSSQSSRCMRSSRTSSCSSPSASSSVDLPLSTSSVRPLPTHIAPTQRSSMPGTPAPEPMQVGDQLITQKTLYTALFVIGIPLLWWSSPLGTFFWLVGASGVLILGHACIMEPGIESEYASVSEAV